MNETYRQAFKDTVARTLFREGKRGKSLIQDIHEEEYAFSLVFRVKDNFGVVFRLEDIKEQAKYLNGGSRARGKDNDCTIIDDAIFQIEVKNNKKIGHTHANQQFRGGELWLRHLLRLVANGDPDIITQTERPIYRLVLKRSRRSSLSRTHAYPILNHETNYQIIIGTNERRIDLTRTKNELMQKYAARKFQLE
ncbi:hypothetical protein [Levilactobacillus fuyuanensis]|uniref:Restriction endonuclease n=1 Tax=Levilactobacillus fuyuanensis TaxID=2486022 RepID=A0ABW4H5L9_9LACO|nr:hypothetical protein [Levilactobacillus fuyuanensis]